MSSRASSSVLQRKGKIVDSRLRAAGEDATSVRQELTLWSSTGLKVCALLRLPTQSPPPHAAAVFTAGFQQGREAANTPGIDSVARHVIVVSPDYPRPSGLRAWHKFDREAAITAVMQVLLLLDYLESRPDVAPQRLFLIGGSLGALVVTVAGGLDPRPAAVAALYGGGGLRVMATHAFRHPAVGYSRWKAFIAGHAAALLLMSLDPLRYASAIAPRPFLMVNGTEDSLLPLGSVFALYEAAKFPKDLVWVRSDHGLLSRPGLFDELAGIVAAWLAKHDLLPREP